MNLDQLDARDAAIEDARMTLHDALREAREELERAEQAVGQLLRLYDVDVAEGQHGVDLQHHVASAARRVRAAIAIDPTKEQ